MKEVQAILPNRPEICLLIKKAFSSEFCDSLVDAHRHTFKPAQLNYPTSYRNNERQIKDDPALSKVLFEEIKKYIPREIVIRGISDLEHGKWDLQRLNPRIRICRYAEGQYFNKHLDGVYYESRQVQSKLTFMIYLNGGNGEFAGGRTLFFPSKEDDHIIGFYQPCKGDLIIFDHNLWHSGEALIKGEKFILRSDILYKKEDDERSKKTGPFAEGHLGYIWKMISYPAGYLSAGRDKLIKVWTKEGQKIGELAGHQNSILDMIMLSNDVLVTCSRDRTIRLWRKTGDDLFVEGNCLTFHQSTVLGLVRLNDRLFASCGADGVINIINLAGERQAYVQAHQEWIWSVELIRENVMASIGEDGLLKIWHTNPLREITSVQMDYPITALAYDEERSMIYVGGINGMISGFKLMENLSLQKVFEQPCHSDKIWVIKCDENRIVSGGEDNKVMIWNKNSMEKLTEHRHKNFVQDLILEQDRIISVSYDGEIRVL